MVTIALVTGIINASNLEEVKTLAPLFLVISLEIVKK